MEKKIIEYGTQHDAEVICSGKDIISVIGDDGEGYILFEVGIGNRAKIGDKGKIIFTPCNNEFRGYWRYEAQ